MDLPKLLDGRLKVRHLVLVDALTRQGSVMGAAAELHMTQPVATRSLRDVEAILGVELYERGPRGITPTIFGEAFTAHARSVLAQLNQAGRHVVELADADRGTAVVGTHLAGSNVLLPQAIARLKAQHPLLTVIVREGPPDALMVELEAGRIDVIVGRLTSPGTDTVLHTPLYEERIEVFAGTHHPLAGSDAPPPHGLADLSEYPWILPGEETALRRELEESFARAGLAMPGSRVEATSFLTVRQLLRETEMIAALPSLIGRDDAHLLRLPVELTAVGHSVGLTLVRGRTLSPSAIALVESLRQIARTRLQ